MFLKIQIIFFSQYRKIFSYFFDSDISDAKFHALIVGSSRVITFVLNNFSLDG